MNALERETVVNASDGDEVVRIWTAQRRFITRLRKHPRVSQIRTGFVGETEWAEFTVPSDQWNPVSGVKRTSAMTEEQKSAGAARLAAARGQR